MNRINSSNKQGPIKVYRDYFKELFINGIDVIKSLKLIKNIDYTNSNIDNLEEVIEFLKNIQDNETLQELIDKVKPVDIFSYIGSNKAMPISPIYSYKGLPISHYRLLNTGPKEYDIVFCIDHNDSTEYEHTYIQFSQVNEGFIYRDTYHDNPNDDNYAPLYIRALFNSALTGETNGTTTIEKGLMSIEDKEKLDKLNVLYNITYDLTENKPLPSTLFLKNAKYDASSNKKCWYGTTDCYVDTPYTSNYILILKPKATYDGTTVTVDNNSYSIIKGEESRIIVKNKQRINFKLSNWVWFDYIKVEENPINILTQELNTKYNKPNAGIPKTDLDSSVQNSLDKANTALQNQDLTPYVTKKEIEDNALVTAAALNDLNSRITSIEDKSEEYVHLFEVYADAQCTQRPVVGVEYDTLYVQINGTTTQCIYGSVTNNIMVTVPSIKYPDDGYWVSLYVDYIAELQGFNYEEDNGFIQPCIVKVDTESSIGKIQFTSDLDVSFGPLIKKNK